MDLSPYQLPIQPAPFRVQKLIQAGVSSARFPPPTQARELLDTPNPPQEGVWRAPEGNVLIICNTDLPDVTPAMVDWWFGWHLPDSSRYALWHPTAHRRARVKEDRSHLSNDRARYLDNVSYVDEYVGDTLKRLSIHFVSPQGFGFTDLDESNATAICAITSDRLLMAEGGSLCHLVLPTNNGCQMRSAFWLGNIRHHVAPLHLLLNAIYNSPFFRKRIITDQFCLDLLRHCSEEMNHLARFLPQLYRHVKSDDRQTSEHR